MHQIDFKEQILPHLVAVLIFLLVTVVYFKPFFFDNKSLSQHDILQWQGAAKELMDFREAHGEEALWTNSMFSGMPAYLINTKWGIGVLTMVQSVISVGLPHPVRIVFLLFIGFYVRLLSFGVRPYLAIAGALAFGRADERAVADLIDLHRRGIRIRPRALTTTLFMRWLAGDLFIHGIGGAIYDRVTDQIAHRWWNAPAPHLMVATATCRLPVDRPDVTREDVVRIEHQLRELAFHPEQFVECDADMCRWIDQKRAAIAESLPRGQRKSRHDRIVEANLAMQEPLRSLKERLLAERESLIEQLRRKQRLGSREFSMALFPRTLPEQLRQLASGDH